ncbi:MAG TPA: polyprenyl diphosphate synthase [Steroidobacteraceae bacterium]|nr:polyprenyl diphosphate synthase [Steroidobacteraceae bacterium]
MIHLLYRLYERRLEREVLRGGPGPQHIALILDGNRRHGERAGLRDPTEIYALGARKLDEVLDWCVALHVPAVTLWVLSTDNLGRSAEELSGILAAVGDKLTALAVDPQIHRQRVRIQAIGQLELLPERTLASIRAAQQATASYDGMVLTIAVAYGGRAEIVDAVRALLSAQRERGSSLDDIIEQIDAEAISRHLYMAGMPDPDLIIRTSGEVRLSGFLLWQSAYSEFYFSDVYWPAFRRIDLLRAIRAYQQRRRRFGN